MSTVQTEASHGAELKSISAIKFGPEGVLFVGDSSAAAIFAFDLGAASAVAGPPTFNIDGIDQKIADRLGAPLDHISMKGLAIHPVTKDAYIAVHRGHGDLTIPVIVRVRSGGDIHPIELAGIPFSKMMLENPVDPELRVWNGVMARTLTITDIEHAGGELFVSGLSNADFASTLYRIPYPFKDALGKSSIEMFHAVHNQNETRAPIQTMTVLDLGGKPHVLAVYTCTPLVTIPVDQLADGAHVKGKTIAELGYGNTPIDILHFQSPDMAGGVQDKILITHKNRGAMLFDVQAIVESNEKEGLTSGVGMKLVAPEHVQVPISGLFHVDEQDAQFLVGLRRDPETGRVDLLSFRKGLYFRLSDFVSEYMLPGYPGADAQTKGFHDMLKKEEGFA